MRICIPYILRTHHNLHTINMAETSEFAYHIYGRNIRICIQYIWRTHQDLHTINLADTSEFA